MKVSGKHYRTIVPVDGGQVVEVIDQTRLPHEFALMRLHTLDDAVRAIADMIVRGAPLIGAAGAVEAVAVLFALAEQTLPATITLRTPDPECDLDYVAERPRPAHVRIALSSSFGFGGQNACLVLAAPPANVPSILPSLPCRS